MVGCTTVDICRQPCVLSLFSTHSLFFLFIVLVKLLTVIISIHSGLCMIFWINFLYFFILLVLTQVYMSLCIFYSIFFPLVLPLISLNAFFAAIIYWHFIYATKLSFPFKLLVLIMQHHVSSCTTESIIPYFHKLQLLYFFFLISKERIY